MVMFAKNADIPTIAKEESLTHDVVHAVNMMKVLQLEQCLISVNFHYT